MSFLYVSSSLTSKLSSSLMQVLEVSLQKVFKQDLKEGIELLKGIRKGRIRYSFSRTCR